MTTHTTRRARWQGVLGRSCLGLGLCLGCSGRTTSAEGDEGTSQGEASTAGEEPTSSLDGSTGAGACEWELAPFFLPEELSPPPACAALVSSGEVAPVTVRIVNEGDDVVWLTGPGSCVDTYTAVEDAAGQRFFGNHCTMLCEASLLGECGCLLDCPSPDIIALHPGGTFETEWPGYVLAPRVASTACAGDCASDCNLRVSPAAGPMTVVVAKATALEDCGACECEPNAQGWCTVPGLPDGFETFEHAVEWPPACPEIEVAVE